MIENLKEWVPYNILIGEPDNPDTHLVEIEEEWRTAVGFDGYYEVSSFGRVKSLERTVPHGRTGTTSVKCKLMTPYIHKSGYSRVYLTKDGKPKVYKIHRLVLMAFNPNPDDKPDCNHRNAVKHNNKLYNLEWSTEKENINHAFDMGLHKSRVGFDNSNCKTTEEQVIMVKKLLKKGLLGSTIAEHTGVSPSIVSRIKLEKSFSHIKI